MTRFLATPEFLATYKEKLKTFYQQIFVDDLITLKIAQYAALVTEYNHKHDLVSQADYDAAVLRTLSILTERHLFLQATELLGQ